MRQWIRGQLTFANVVSLAALFVALGGTAYAATVGNFILGKPNTAGSQTSLTASTSFAGKALQLTNTNTGAGATALGLTDRSQPPIRPPPRARPEALGHQAHPLRAPRLGARRCVPCRSRREFLPVPPGYPG